jgi:hypothetical protein
MGIPAIGVSKRKTTARGPEIATGPDMGRKTAVP